MAAYITNHKFGSPQETVNIHLCDTSSEFFFMLEFSTRMHSVELAMSLTSMLFPEFNSRWKISMKTYIYPLNSHVLKAC